jgi:hypothetical protein
MKLGRLIALALIAQLLVVPATSGMLVLCFGSDGHVAVESASESECCREWDTAHGESPDLDLPTIESASGPCCNDVGLSLESATLTAPVQKVVPASSLPCRVPVLASPLRAADPETLPPSAESSVAASLRTVVLLT